MQNHLILLIIFIFTTPIGAMKSRDPFKDPKWKHVHTGEIPYRNIMPEQVEKYKQLKAVAGYETYNSIKNGFCCINLELVEHVERGNLPMVKFLLELGANCDGNPNVHRWSADLRRPITAAARAGNIAMCQMLLDAGADVNAQEYDINQLVVKSDGREKRLVIRYDALWHAVHGGHVEIANMLFAHGIQNPPNNEIKLPRRQRISDHKNFGQMEQLLAARGIRISMRSECHQRELDTYLIDDVDQYRYDWARLHIEMGANLNFYDNKNCWSSALIRAAKKGYFAESFVKLFLQEGADPNLSDSDGNTPVMYAVSCSSSEGVCKLLLNFGANLLHQNDEGNTALMIAASQDQFNREKVCPILIEHQKEQVKRAVTLILCLKHHESASGKEFYKLSKHVLRPYLEQYTLKALLNIKNNEGKTAYDYYNVDWLKPIE